ncbi:MAG: AtpZ/AtpI family protein [Planctomycetes bacterium]|nr:AtpZ/AtpI family protein [Planctomycetota bacterium]MCB9829459.1 AtpZ/AtpI family protein [Planctomycetota bacterium]MCB9900163.1 AtpZ/AtpI family protein [Planctomycetota bacterium]
MADSPPPPRPSGETPEDLPDYHRPTMDWEREADGSIGSAMSWATVGIELAATVFLFGLLGWWLDGRFGTTPWLLVVLAMLGVTAALIRIIRRATQEERADEKAERDGRG